MNIFKILLTINVVCQLVKTMMENETILLEQYKNLEDLPLDNYRVSYQIPTENVEKELLLNPKLSGVFVLKKDRVIGVISRRKFFEQMSREYAREIYSERPVQLLLNNLNYKPLKIPASTEINDGVKLALSRDPEYIYEPIVVTQNDEYVGMLELSVLIFSQAQMFSEINDKLIHQEKKLRKSAKKIEEEKNRVKEYAQQLESEQKKLKQANQLLEKQTQELERQKGKLLLQKEKIAGLNEKFAELAIILSEEGKITFSTLKDSVNKVIKFTEEINHIGSNFQEKFQRVNEATELIRRINKRVENLSFQASVMAANLPANDYRGTSVQMISEEIEKLSVQIAEANTTVDQIAKELKPEIKTLVATADKNQKVVMGLSHSSESTELALNKLSNLVEKKQKNDS